MDTQVWLALLTAFTSLGIAVFELLRGQRNAKELETLKDRLAEQQAQRDARREYEYHALQRLYQEYEPLRFQLLDAVENAKIRIEELGAQQSIREQGLEGLYPANNYLLLSTIYHLLLPSAVFRIICRRLTMVDLRLDPAIELEYLLAKKALLVLGDDAAIARLSGLDYTPYVDGWREKRVQNPQKFRRQGLPRGRLDNALDALVTRLDDSTKQERIISFGEFEDMIAALPDDDVRSGLGAARDLFLNFDPVHRPVLWRALLVQYFLYKAILTSAGAEPPKTLAVDAPFDSLSEREATLLGWKPEAGGATISQDAAHGVARYLAEVVVPDITRINRRRLGPDTKFKEPADVALGIRDGGVAERSQRKT